ncbi:MAG: PEP-CTERM sorting domain-containing protein [Kiritimatiellaeota bacterium]|nr:PEP-CTERM sorting domain-containing protein [Kiritimatiellota bacterium]
MKKFMFIATVIASAGILQAASISWSAASGSGVGSDGYVYVMTGTSTDYSAVVALLGAGNVAGFQSYFNSLDRSTDYTVGSIAANSHLALGAGTTTSGLFLSSHAGSYGTPDNFLGGSSQSVFFVIFDGADPLSADNYSVSYLYNQNLLASGARNYAITWANWGGQGVAGVWLPIPEPTTMVVMAAGIAALGLRRRFRK